MNQKLHIALVILFGLLIGTSGQVTAGKRPVFKDAACDALDLRYRSTVARIDPRELNFLLFDAVAKGCIDLTVKILDNGAVVTARDRFGNTPLLVAARMGHNSIIDLMIERGANVHQLNLAGSSALLRAVTNGRRKAAKRLLELEVDVNLANKKGMTPLIAASYTGKKRVVKMLLDNGADVSAVDSSGKGSLVYAAGKGYVSIARLLLSTNKIDVNKKYGNNLTALMWAAGHGNDVPEREGIEIVNLLLDEGAELDHIDNRGRTALSIAASRGHEALTMLLLEKGAGNIADKQGLTAADLASNARIKELLQSHEWPRG
ncbi:hypothetical protein AB833_25420 [Chromatiales bacterium (ex Bugula neritina AB1)]|nr:hypothetical protein AB833_25420 [Chromatiales bacterium (ex Bugula neritina AB1)]